MNKKQLQVLEVGREVQVVKTIKAGSVGYFVITSEMELNAGKILRTTDKPIGVESGVDRVKLSDGYYYTHNLITYPRKKS